MHDSDDPDSTAPPAVIKARRRRPAPGRSASYRSRITNGTALLPSVDGNSIWARLVRDTIDAMVAHLGGADHVTETQRMACRRIAVLETELIFQEDRMGQQRLAGRVPEPGELDLYSRLTNTQRRLCECLGWQRVPRDIVPTLEAYLRAKTPGGEQN